MPGLRSKEERARKLNSVAECGLRVGPGLESACSQILRENLLEFASLTASRGPAVGDKPGESRIMYIAEVTHGAPEFHSPRVFVFDERREPQGAPFKKRCAYLSDEASSDTLSPMRGSDCQTIDVPAPPVPSADYRSDNLVVDRCDQK